MAPPTENETRRFYPAPFPDQLPTINLDCIRSQDLFNPTEQASSNLLRILRNEGFFYLDLRSDPYGHEFLELSEQIHNAAIDIFSNVPVATKEEWKGDPLYGVLDRGYRALGKDETGQPRVAEVLNVPAYEISHYPDFELPTWLSKYRDIYKGFAEHGYKIAQALLASLDQSLHLEKGTLTDIHDRNSGKTGGFVRIFRMPVPLRKGEEDYKTTTPTPAHTDGNSITLLFNWQGGLQIARPTGDAESRAVQMIDNYDRLQDEWLWVKPKPGHVIVNLGDTMVALTNGLLAAGRHRVVTPPGPQASYHRYSVLTGIRARSDTPMHALKSDVIPPETEQQKAKQTVTALEYAVNKVRAILQQTDQTKF